MGVGNSWNSRSEFMSNFIALKDDLKRPEFKILKKLTLDLN
jgi:hypothetical protein